MNIMYLIGLNLNCPFLGITLFFSLKVYKNIILGFYRDLLNLNLGWNFLKPKLIYFQSFGQQFSIIYKLKFWAFILNKQEKVEYNYNKPKITFLSCFYKNFDFEFGIKIILILIWKEIN